MRVNVTLANSRPAPLPAIMTRISRHRVSALVSSAREKPCCLLLASLAESVSDACPTPMRAPRHQPAVRAAEANGRVSQPRLDFLARANRRVHANRRAARQTWARREETDEVSAHSKAPLRNASLLPVRHTVRHSTTSLSDRAPMGGLWRRGSAASVAAVVARLCGLLRASAKAATDAGLHDAVAAVDDARPHGCGWRAPRASSIGTMRRRPSSMPEALPT